MVIQHSYVNINPYWFRKTTKHVRSIGHHDPLMGARVAEMTLCVTFGAPHSPNQICCIMLCSKYIMICMVSGTHVLQTTLCVTFGARLRTGSLEPPGPPRGRPGRQERPRTPKRSFPTRFGAASVVQGSHEDLSSDTGGFVLASDGVSHP